MAHPTACAARPLPPVIVHIIERIDATARSCRRTVAAGAHADPAAFAEAQLLLPELAVTRAEMLRFHEIDQLSKNHAHAARQPAKKAQAGGAQ